MKNILDSIGNSPLIKLDNIGVKLEQLNPSGSIKDRIAKYIIERAERSSKIKKGYTVIEASSGNTGIAFSMVCAIKGYKMIVVMPRGFSKERKKIIESYGAKLINVQKDCFSCALHKVKELAKRKKAFLPNQFSNSLNAKEHEKNLGQEIIEQFGKVDAFVAGVGTGGTVIGVGKALKKHNPDAKIFALEPAECPLLSESLFAKSVSKTCKHHRIEGIGDGIIPDIIKRNTKVIDEVIQIKSNSALNMAKKLAKRGYFVGPSSGANFLAALRLKKKFKRVVTLFPDSGDRYLSLH